MSAAALANELIRTTHAQVSEADRLVTQAAEMMAHSANVEARLRQRIDLMASNALATADRLIETSNQLTTARIILQAIADAYSDDIRPARCCARMHPHILAARKLLAEDRT